MNQENVVVLDVRTPEEFNAGYIPGAILINFKDSIFTQKINALDKSKHYLVYCKTGNRSNKAVQYMLNNGFSKVQQLENGFSKWKAPAIKP
jgi:rhodanese-related sulfurtransferase